MAHDWLKLEIATWLVELDRKEQMSFVRARRPRGAREIRLVTKVSREMATDLATRIRAAQRKRLKDKLPKPSDDG